MKDRVLILYDQNPNLPGEPQKDIRGVTTRGDVSECCAKRADEFGLEAWFEQSSNKGRLIDWIHEARTYVIGIIINPGGYAHASIAVFDALNAFIGVVLEVQVANIHRRPAIRHRTDVSPRADGMIAGFGVAADEPSLRRVAGLAT